MIQTLLTSIDDQLAQAATWTIVHSLWQGGLLALAMSAVNSRYSKAHHRYILSVATLALILLSSIITFYTYYTDLPSALSTVTSTAIVSGVETSTRPAAILEGVRAWFDLRSETILLVWLTGVILFLLKVSIGLGYVQYLKTGVQDQKLTDALSTMKQRLAISLDTKVLASARVTIPVVVGSLKPIILIPVALVNQLNTKEVEAILAHELAHVLRQDFLANLIIHLIEALYYYHPAVWWVSANIRAERENSCDDLALQSGVSPLLYAQTLTKIEAMQARHTPTLAMALTNSKSQLVHRITRILNMKQTKRNMKEKTIATMLLLSIALLFSTKGISGIDRNHNTLIPTLDRLPAAHEARAIESTLQDRAAQMPSPSLLSPPHTMQRDTTPLSRSTVTIQTDTNGKKMKLQKENGQITHLEIDGEVIPQSRYDEYKDLTDDVIIMGDGDSKSMFFFGDGGSFQGFPDFDFGDMRLAFPQDFTMPDMENMEDILQGFQMPDMERFGGDPEALEEMVEKMMEGVEGIYGDSLQIQRFELDLEDFGNNFGNIFEDTDGVFLSPNEEDYIFPQRDNNRRTVATVLGNELNRDGLLEPFKTNQIQLTGKHLKINGDKQPKNIWSKYKRIYEENTGIPLSKKARLDFEFEGKKSDRKIRSF